VFVQTIEIRTSDFGPIQRAMEAYVADTEGVRTVVSSTVLHDRADPDRWLLVVEFASPESAAHNSELPATGLLAQAIGQAADAEIVFHDHDLHYRHD
jgi:hypothetical protein